MSIAMPRALAFVVDLSVLFAVFSLSNLFAWDGSVVLNAVLYLGYRAVLPSVSRADTLGRLWLALRVEARGVPGSLWWRSLLKELPVAFCLASPVLGLPFGLLALFSGIPAIVALDFLVASIRPDGLSARDLLAGTRTVRLERSTVQQA